MNPTSQSNNRLRQMIWIGVAFAVLVVWPIGSHLAWLNRTWPLHGRPAFFLGLFILPLLAALVNLAAGARRRGWRWLFRRQALGRLLTNLLLALSVLILFYSLEYWCGKRAWACVAAEASLRGISLDAKSFIRPPVPADQDFAQAPLFAPLQQAVSIARDASGNILKPDLGALTNVLALGSRMYWHNPRLPLAPWMEGRTTDLAPWLNACLMLERPDAKPPETNRPAAAKAILTALAPVDGMIEELRAYSGRSHCQLPFDYELAYFSEYYPERTLLSFMRILRLRATAELALDQNDAAFRDVQLALRLAWHLRHHPTLYYESARDLCLADGLQPFWEGWVARRWTAAQLETLQRQLSEFNPLADYSAHARFVAFANAAFIESIIPTSTPKNDPIRHLHPMAQQGLLWIRRIYPVGWSLQDQAAIWSVGLRQETALKTEPSLRLEPASRVQLSRDLAHGSSDPFFPVYITPRVNMMFDDLQGYLPFAQTVTELAALACALERHRLTVGEYPEALQNLVPSFIAQVPPDPMTGADFRYRRLPTGSSVLYSLGANKVDDQGQSAPRRRRWDGAPESEPDLSKGDWVWTTAPTLPRPGP